MLFRSPALSHAVGYMGAMVRLEAWSAPAAALALHLNAEVLTAVAAGVLFAFPLRPSSARGSAARGWRPGAA